MRPVLFSTHSFASRLAPRVFCVFSIYLPFLPVAGRDPAVQRWRILESCLLEKYCVHSALMSNCRKCDSASLLTCHSRRGNVLHRLFHLTRDSLAADPGHSRIDMQLPHIVRMRLVQSNDKLAQRY